MRKIGLMLLISISWLLLSSGTNVVAQEETVTILTYYPAPYGIYQTLEVLRQDGTNANLMISQYRDGNIYPMITFRKADNTLTSPWAIWAIDDDDRLGTIVFNGHDGTSFRTGAEIYAIAEENWTADKWGTQLRFRTRYETNDLIDRMIITDYGNVVVQGQYTNTNLIVANYDNGSGTSIFRLRKADKNIADPHPIDNGDTLGSIRFEGYDDNGFDTGAEINAVADADWGADERGTEIRFRTRDDNGSLTDRMTISAAGNVWVTREAGSPYLTLSSYDNDSSDFPVLRVRKADNNIADPHAIHIGDILGVLRFEGRDDDSFETGANIYAVADANWSASQRGTEIRFSNRDGDGSLTNRMYIKANGRIGIGESDPIGALHVETTASAIPAIRGESTWGSGLYAESANYHGIHAISTATGGSSIGVWGEGNDYAFFAGGNGLIHGSFEPFTGSHEVKFYSEDIEPGLIVVSAGECETRAKTFSDTIPTVELCQDVMDKRILGVFVKEKNLDEKYWYKPKKGEKIGRVNALGDGLVLVTDANGPIENGDYITTSQIPGYGQKQDDDILHSYTLGKAIQSVDWDNITDTIEFNGKRYKKCLIAVTYHCG